MTQAAANASAATELRNAAWIRNQIAATDKRSNRRAGMQRLSENMLTDQRGAV